MSVLAAVMGYLIGSLPMGYIFVRIFRRQDITQIGSGRTGGTNAMRAGGIWIGMLTALSDLLKGFLSVEIARRLAPGLVWIHILAGFFAVLGHNWSIWLYLLTRKLSAGAGTGPNIGAAMAFYPGVILISVPLILLFVFVVGYASLASLAAALALVIIFAYRAIWAGAPWEYIIYGLMTFILVSWALRPNIQRLLQGTERRVGIFAPKNPQNP